MGGMEMLGVGVLISYSVAGMNQITGMDKALNKLWIKTSEGTYQLTKMGRQMSFVAAGAIAMAGGMAMVNATMNNIQAYADYQTSMAHVQGLLTYTREEMQAFESQAYDTARATRFTAGETMDAFWELLSAGYSEAQALDLLDATLKGAVIGHMEVADSADMLTSAMKAFMIPAEDSLQVMDMLTAGVRISKIHFDEYAQAFGTMGSSASAANASLEDTIALFGVMRSAGMSGSKAAMMVKMMYMHLMGRSEGVEELMRGLGVNLVDAISGQMRPLKDIVGDIFTVLPELPSLEGLSGEQMELMDDEALERIIYAEDRLGAMADIFGLRAVAGLYALKNAQIEVNGELLSGLEAFDAMSGFIENSAGYTNEYYETLVDTFNEQKAILEATVDLLKVQLGSGFEGTVGVLEFINSALATVSQFLQDYPQVAAAIGWIGLIGGVLAILGGFVLVIAGLASIIAGMWMMVLVVGMIIGGLGSIIAVIASEIGLVIAYWEELEPVFTAVGNWLWEHILEPIVSIATGVGKLLAIIGKFLWETIIAPVLGVLLPVLAVAFALVSWIVGLFIIGLRFLWGIAETVIAFIDALVNWDWSGFEAKLDEIWASVGEDIQAIGTLFLDTITAAILGVVPAVMKELFPVGNQEVYTAGGANGEAPRLTGYGLSSMAWSEPGSFAAGSTRITRDGLGYLHEGEDVSQRGQGSINDRQKAILGNITFNVYGVQDGNTFMADAYAKLRELMNRDMEMTVRA